MRRNRLVALGAVATAAAVVLSLLSWQASGAAGAAAGYDYAEALQDSMFFYDAQRSGQLAPDNPVDWRGDSDPSDGSDNGVNLTGGFHDAGDLVKFGLPQAYSTTMLAWGLVDYQQGYQDAGQYQAALANLRWNDDYIIAAHTAPDVYYAQVGNPNVDHQYWGPAETNPTTRPSFAVTASCPGSDLVGEAAAATAASSIVFSKNDPKYSAALLSQAQSLFAFANTYRGNYSSCVTSAQGFYTSVSGYWDELTAAAIWLYRATGDATWLTTAETDYANLPLAQQQTYHEYNWTISWDDVSYADYIMMAQLTGASQYVTDAERWLDWWTTGYAGSKVSYSPGGEAFLNQWGSLRYASNTAFGALEFADYLTANGLDPTRAATYQSFAQSQINYALGANPNHMSYEVGFTNGGTNSSWPSQPHNSTAHDSWSDNLTTPAQTRHLDYGLLVGGPASADDSYTDQRSNYTEGEGALDYNALFTGALARLVQSNAGTTASGFPAPESPDGPEMYVQAALNSVGSNFVEIKALVTNQSAWPARPLTNSSIRYYFTLDPGETASQITLASPYDQCDAPSGPTQYSGNVYYVTVSCANLDIAPDGEADYPGIDYQAQVQFRITFPAAHTYQNDWSFQGIPSATNATPVTVGGIALYQGNTLVWGAPPSTGAGPSAPALTASAVTSTSATLSWPAATAGSSPVSGYVVRTSAGSVVGTTSSTSFPVTGLNPNRTTPYGFFVQAIDANGLASAGSNIATLVTSANTSGDPSATAPSVPGTVVAAVSGSGATLSWGASVAGSAAVTGYRVYELAPSATFVATTTTPSYQVTGLVAGTTYAYEVVATAASGPTSLGSAPAVFSSTSGSTPPTTTPPTTTTTTTTPPTTTATPPTTSPPPTTTTTSSGPGGCSAAYSVVNSWSGGFQGQVTVTAGSAAISGWTVQFTFGGDQKITQVWSASDTQTGEQVSATPLSYNAALGAGASTSFGFNGSYVNSNAAPTGVTCTAH
jgi:endoglucanase